MGFKFKSVFWIAQQHGECLMLVIFGLKFVRLAFFQLPMKIE